MIASFPMYDRPENAAAHDALWSLIRDALRDEGVPAPHALDREIDIVTGWGHPELVFGQICGLPLRRDFHDRVEVIGTLDFGLADTPAGHYRSVFVARHDDAEDAASYADRHFAFNDESSHSGWAAPQLFAKRNGFSFRNPTLTGAHRQSAAAVASGKADIAALDEVSWRFIRAHDKAAQALKVIGRTDASPGLAFIAAKGTDTTAHFRALKTAVGTLSDADRHALGIRGLAHIPLSDYLAVPTPPGPGQATGDTPES
ncbi:phosphate/phosphite/phosphonate ABC transporter substrate-binding protein [Actibacterium lipolyticum]|uniref:ABC transporter, phosphonate, periplasmic substrate-binding protein n=1 Tax=Actibacterium lipolyticum TaxID=1524263 RepID=A0A238KL14_9RHOB|nr:PhnD/SsuA/transferrin family substrate-binding protein [Actibacterium lipolyticum]SMX43454.1 ABC transporter, phosphonate, periplasmic substrate-binding protein [Actibacterium lipolyticum]